MKIAVPLLGARISPGLWSARELLVYQVEKGLATGHHRVYLGSLRRISDFVDWLCEHHVGLVMCDKTSAEICKALNDRGIDVIWGVTGEPGAAIAEFLECHLGIGGGDESRSRALC